MYVVLTLVVEEAQEDGGFVGRCKELPITTEGDSLDEVFGNLDEAVFTYLNDIEGAGLRERVFKQQGIEMFEGELALEPFDVVPLGKYFKKSLQEIPQQELVTA